MTAPTCPDSPQPGRRVRPTPRDAIHPEASASTHVDLAQPLLTAGDIAALLGVPRSSVYDYARRKEDPLPSAPCS